MAFGFLARPFKDIHKAVKKVGGGVSKVGRSAVGAAKGAVRGAVGGAKSAGPTNKLKKKMLPGTDY
jgi:hypothetical protein